MRAVLIDPLTKTVTDVEIGDSLRELYHALGDDVTSADIVTLDAHHICWIDGVGLLKHRPGPFFSFDFKPTSVFSGRGLILGDDDGDRCDAIVSADILEAVVSFPDIELDGFEEYSGVETVDGLGEVLVHRMTPVYRKRVANDNH